MLFTGTGDRWKICLVQHGWKQLWTLHRTDCWGGGSSSCQQNFWMLLQLQDLPAARICKSAQFWSNTFAMESRVRMNSVLIVSSWKSVDYPYCPSWGSSQGELQIHWSGNMLMEIIWYIVHFSHPNWIREGVLTYRRLLRAVSNLISNIYKDRYFTACSHVWSSST